MREYAQVKRQQEEKKELTNAIKNKDKDLEKFLCEKAKMRFYTNPYNEQKSENFMLVKMDCEMFAFGKDKLGLHFFFPNFTST